MPVERSDRKCNEHPQKQHLNESPSSLIPGEEEPSPKRICGKLGDEQTQGDGYTAADGLAPDKPSSYGHEQVQSGPDRAE